MENKINSFFNEFSFLSNFYHCKVTYEGIEYANAESAYQAAKCFDINQRKDFINLTGGRAKHLGHEVKQRGDWAEIRLNIMADIVRIKFTENLDLKTLLKNTDNAYLIEGNTWHDNFYGDCSCPECENIIGQNHLGRILMELRENL